VAFSTRILKSKWPTRNAPERSAIFVTRVGINPNLIDFSQGTNVNYNSFPADRSATDSCLGTGYHQIHDRCFYIGEELITWFEARTQCESRGGDLAIVASRELREELHVYLDGVFPYAKKIWIGMQKGGWHWSSGQFALEEITSFIVLIV
jgi:hypothetical protein